MNVNKTPLPRLTLAGLLVLLNACAIGPDYQRPTMSLPEHYAEQTWQPAAPADGQNRGAWWEVFKDAQLNELEAQVEVSNQNVVAAKAAYDQARSLVSQARAAMFPAVDLSGNATRNGDSSAHTQSNKYQVSIGTTWELDVWGSLIRADRNVRASAQASAADLAAATLSAQGELASSYFSLRETDIEYALDQATVTAYQRSLLIAQNLFNAGVTTSSDVLQAQTQLANAQADLLGLERQRIQFERAIAVLIGKTPEEFSLAPDANWQASQPQVPTGVPSEILQRRPDIAGAERRVAAANELIGIAKAGYFPSLKLNASEGASASGVASLFDNNLNIWSIGASLSQSIFDAGANRAKVAGARAAHQAAAAHYRQTVLTAFADVENQLTAIRILKLQYSLRQQASSAADKVEQQALNRYRQGQISYTDVVSAQTAAFNARRALAQAAADSQNAAVALIQSLGGGWQAESTH